MQVSDNRQAARLWERDSMQAATDLMQFLRSCRGNRPHAVPSVMQQAKSNSNRFLQACLQFQADTIGHVSAAGQEQH
jgi:hypothetical protein